jgi:hypothetical protein
VSSGSKATVHAVNHTADVLYGNGTALASISDIILPRIFGRYADEPLRTNMTESVSELALYQKCVKQTQQKWPDFLKRRNERLAQQERNGTAAEKVAENILEDLFVRVLDWPLSDFNNQVGYADILLTTFGIKYLIVEAKRPGALAWNRRAVEAALAQAQRYAAEQRVKCVGVSDGIMLYAADILGGGLKGRFFGSLAGLQPPEALWWLSVHGIYRPVPDGYEAVVANLPDVSAEVSELLDCGDGELLHPKYKIPARCFAYMGDANDPGTWKLPFRLADGHVDLKRLPKAIQCIASNYRGERVTGIPEKHIPDVLLRLARAASSVGKMPHQSPSAAAVYCQLAEILRQLGKLEEVSDDVEDVGQRPQLPDRLI